MPTCLGDGSRSCLRCGLVATARFGERHAPPLHECADPPDRLEVLGSGVGIANRDAHPRLEEQDHVEHAHRVDDATVNQRGVNCQLRRVRHVELLDDEGADVVLSRHLESPPRDLTEPALGVARSTSVPNSIAGMGCNGARSCSWSNPVDNTPTSAMLSAFVAGAARRLLRHSRSTAAGLKTPASTRWCGLVTSWTQSGTGSPVKAAASGARYGCLGRAMISSGTSPFPTRFRMYFSVSPRSLKLGGSEFARPVTSVSRNGKRPSTECAISIRSPWDARRYPVRSVRTSRY